MKSFKIVLILVILTSCSRINPKSDSKPLPSQEPISNSTQTPATHQSGEIFLTDTQEVVNNLAALCCADGWWDHLVDAENQFDETKNKGEEIDIGEAFLKRLEAAGTRFDANEYFTELTHLALEDGYLLDYVYYAPGDFGAPYLYARREGEPVIRNYSQYQETNVENFLTHIQLDGTAEGYFELAVMSIISGKFYLASYAEYADWEVVSNPERLEEIIGWMNEEYLPLTSEQIEAAFQLDLTPRVIFEAEKVLVQMVVFTKWGGFFNRVFTIDQSFPHQMMEEDFQLIPYNCGIVY